MTDSGMYKEGSLDKPSEKWYSFKWHLRCSITLPLQTQLDSGFMMGVW